MAKYKDWLTGDKLLLLEAWARDGCADVDIAKNMGISLSTLYEWKNKFPEFSEAIKKGKEVVDVKVENALLKKAMGYTVDLQKTFKVKTVEYDERGRKVSEKEKLQQGVDQVHIPADTTAQIFWLKNRKPDKWRDKPATDADAEALNKLDGLINEFRDAVKPETN